MLDATPQRKNYEEDWDSNRKYAQAHLLEVWGSLNAAGHGLALDCDRCPTHREQRDTDVRRRIVLEAEINRLKEALAVAEANSVNWTACYQTVGEALQAIFTKADERAKPYQELDWVVLFQRMSPEDVEALRQDAALAEADVKFLKDAFGRYMQARSGANPPDAKELANRVRRIVIGSIHPDTAADPAEREWRTKICQTLFPEIDRVMNEA